MESISKRKVIQIRSETVKMEFFINGMSLEFFHSFFMFDETIPVKKHNLSICFQLKRANMSKVSTHTARERRKDA